jgi:Transglycosylase SLT domain
MAHPGGIQTIGQASDAWGQAIDGIGSAIRTAAARTGIDFSYLMAQARVESGLNPKAQARGSSARGLYQFTNSTWLETVRKHGAAHGLGWAADAIASGAAGAGSAARATILGLRDNAEAAALMAGEFARDNGAALEKRLGHAAGATDLYMAHFLGAGGAARFLEGLAAAPGAAAAALLPAAAAANRAVFFQNDGSPRSLAQVYDHFAARFEAVPAPPVRPAPAGPSAVNGPAAIDASRARMAYMLLAELGG